MGKFKELLNCDHCGTELVYTGGSVCFCPHCDPSEAELKIDREQQQEELTIMIDGLLAPVFIGGIVVGVVIAMLFSR